MALTLLIKDVDEAARLLRAGQLVAFPTETVYGLGADATNSKAVDALYRAKGRPSHNPLIVHVPDSAAAFALTRASPDAVTLAEAFWPGPMTLVLPRAEASAIVPAASSGLPTLAVRVPAHSIAHALLVAAGRPIVAPSANPSGRLSPTRAEHVMASLMGRIAAVLDGGATPVGLESTVVGCLDGKVFLLRPGFITRDALEHALDRPLDEPPENREATPLAPGQLESHYAPRARLRLDAESAAEGEGLLAFGPAAPAHTGPTINLSPTGDLTAAAARLFDALHELDATGVSSIAVMRIPETGIGYAILDRLRRAAADRPRDSGGA
ncbi:MAG: L-threonylcarbamoyladenylate synthase [Hyphomicrobiales bacterium]